MKVSYERLFNKLKENNISQKDFRESANISGTTMQKMLHRESVTIDTICKICDYFHCMPDEIMEFIPDEDYEDKRKAKSKVEAQIAALQKKLKEL